MPDSADSSIQAALLDQQVRERAAVARSAGEWFDIYNSIVETGVKTTMEQNGQGHLVMDQLVPRRADAAKVRHILEVQGMELSDDVEIEGAVVQQDERGITTMVAWPAGQWLKLHWPDGSMVEFRGGKAMIALGFIMWWGDFHRQFVTLKSPGKEAPIKRRIIQPGSIEHKRYFDKKAKDQAEGKEP